MNEVLSILMFIFIFGIVAFKILYTMLEEEIGMHRWIFGWMKFSYFITIINFMKTYKNMDQLEVSNYYNSASWFNDFNIRFVQDEIYIEMNTHQLKIDNQFVSMCLFQYLIWRHYMHKIRRDVIKQKKIEKETEALNKIEKVVSSIKKTTITRNDKKGALSLD